MIGTDFHGKFLGKSVFHVCFFLVLGTLTFKEGLSHGLPQAVLYSVLAIAIAYLPLPKAPMFWAGAVIYAFAFPSNLGVAVYHNSQERIFLTGLFLLLLALVLFYVQKKGRTSFFKHPVRNFLITIAVFGIASTAPGLPALAREIIVSVAVGFQIFIWYVPYAVSSLSGRKKMRTFSGNRIYPALLGG